MLLPTGLAVPGLHALDDPRRQRWRRLRSLRVRPTLSWSGYFLTDFGPTAFSNLPHRRDSRGPPSGGAGGEGGSIYIQASDDLLSLNTVLRTVRGATGANGQGDFTKGKKGEPTIVRFFLLALRLEIVPTDPDLSPYPPYRSKYLQEP